MVDFAARFFNSSIEQTVVNAAGLCFPHSLLSYPVYTVHPGHKMALKVEKPDLAADGPPTSTVVALNPVLASSQVSGSDSDDLEARGGRRMSRIDKPLESDTDSSLTIGKQIALEVNNPIKYRTCSWQKA